MRLIGLFLIVVGLSSCCGIQETPCARHYAICNELNRQIMYANATSNQQIGIQRRNDLIRLHQAFIEERC
jgi:hypothetical protein